MNDSQIMMIGGTLLGCFALTFLLSGMESGVLAISPLRIRQLRRQGNRRAQLLHNYLEKPEGFLWTILVGNTLANFIAVALAFFVLFRLFEQRPWLLVTLFIAGGFLFFVFAELLPKMLFRQYPNRLCLMLVGPFRIIDLLLRPGVFVVERFSRSLLKWTGGARFTGRLFGSREELRFLMQESAEVLSNEERAMINRVLDLPNLKARQLMVPLGRALSVRPETSMKEVRAFFQEHIAETVPVISSGKGNDLKVHGVIHVGILLKDVAVDHTRHAQDYMRAPLYIEAELGIEEALRRMRRTGRELGVVVGPGNRDLGILTMQDILKLVFGELG